ncbi:alpha/beta fold hydrolase [Rhodococcus sp. NPDC057529]|uniref:alpha/beta fold hydrolase n=1 Tax=Rhodococcus sp. NPDC057529 TaxID=3346158 RepID=UPI003671D97A
MPRIIRDDGARLEYEVRPAAGGAATASFLFQHGMGGNRQQPLSYLGALPATDLIAMDARGHGNSSDVLAPSRCDFGAFADDVIALADRLELDRFVMGGISLGAAVALNVAIRYPDRISALVICRPAWLDVPHVDRNRGAYAQIADLLDTHEVDEALDLFTQTPTHKEVETESLSAAQSLRHQITRPRAALNAEILRRFPGSSPAPDLAAWRQITAPTLVIGHTDDPFHPWAIAESTANRVPEARLVEVTSKDRDPGRFATEIDEAIHTFLDHVTTA